VIKVFGTGWAITIRKRAYLLERAVAEVIEGLRRGRYYNDETVSLSG